MMRRHTSLRRAFHKEGTATEKAPSQGGCCRRNQGFSVCKAQVPVTQGVHLPHRVSHPYHMHICSIQGQVSLLHRPPHPQSHKTAQAKHLDTKAANKFWPLMQQQLTCDYTWTPMAQAASLFSPSTGLVHLTSASRTEHPTAPPSLLPSFDLCLTQPCSASHRAYGPGSCLAFRNVSAEFHLQERFTRGPLPAEDSQRAAVFGENGDKRHTKAPSPSQTSPQRGPLFPPYNRV